MPRAPVSPLGPWGPVPPVSPLGPWGTWLGAKSCASSEASLTFLVVTACLARSLVFTWPLAMCRDLMLFSLSAIAAYELPPSTMKRHSDEMTLA
jgi:hypothetical protein